MPLSENDLAAVRGRVFNMFKDTIGTFEVINEHADAMYGKRAGEMRAAIEEHLNDFYLKTELSGEPNPEQRIFETARVNYQRAGLYGAQLNVKERQVTTANMILRQHIADGVQGMWRQAFRKWADIINNFLGSLASATGFSEALMELKDCLRDELPDDDD